SSNSGCSNSSSLLQAVIASGMMKAKSRRVCFFICSELFRAARMIADTAEWVCMIGRRPPRSPRQCYVCVGGPGSVISVSQFLADLPVQGCKTRFAPAQCTVQPRDADEQQQTGDQARDQRCQQEQGIGGTLGAPDQVCTLSVAVVVRPNHFAGDAEWLKQQAVAAELAAVTGIAVGRETECIPDGMKQYWGRVRPQGFLQGRGHEVEHPLPQDIDERGMQSGCLRPLQAYIVLEVSFPGVGQCFVPVRLIAGGSCLCQAALGIGTVRICRVAERLEFQNALVGLEDQIAHGLFDRIAVV